MRRPCTVFAAVVVTAFLLAATAPYTQALHRNTPRVVQVTGALSASVGGVVFAGRSNVVLFHADGDLLGNGNATSQIFAFDLAGRVKRGQVGLYQLTDGALGSYAPSGAKRGRIVAFHSEADLLSNGSTGRQIFAATKVQWKKNRVPIFQVTRGPGESFDALVNDNGKFLLFSSTDDLLGEGLPVGTRLYRADLRRLPKTECPGYPCPEHGNPGLVRITDDAIEGATIDKKGTQIAFIARWDAAGTGCGTGTAQLFLWDERAGTTEQLTCGAGDSRGPVFTRSFRGVLFESDADLLGTADGQTQIYHRDVFSSSPTLSQLTFGSDGDSQLPAPNGTSRRDRFFFLSSADLTGGGAPSAQALHLYDAFTGLRRLTNGLSVLSGLSGQFVFAAFASDDDLLGNGNDSPQLFIVNADLAPGLGATPTPTATPTPVLDHLVVAPASDTFAVGEIETFTVTAHFSSGGTQNYTQRVAYASSAPEIAAALNTEGNKSQIEGVSPGVATISAVDPESGVSSTDSGDDAVVTITGPLERVTLAPSSTTLGIGQAETFTATGHYGGGTTQNLTQQVVYTSSDPSVVTTPNTPGNRSRVEAIGAGTASITALHEDSGISSADSGDDATVIVNP